MRCSQRALLSRWLLFYARTRPVRPIFFPSSYVSPSLHPAAIAPAAPVAELGVVRRSRTSRVKKYAIIALLAAVAVFAYFQWRRSMDDAVAFHYGHRGRITILTRELIEHRTSSLIIGPHPALNAKLDELGIRASSDYSAFAARGDAPAPIGDGRGTQHLFIIRHADSQRVLGIRLRYEPATQTYHLLGFWTPTNA